MAAAPRTTHWKLTLSYDGSAFHGWQIQPGLATIQGLLSESLHRLTGEHVLPQGSGRTDAGVHALAQVASFSLAAPLPAANLQRALNQMLPSSIRVLHAEIAPPGFHARHSACAKTYEYRILELREDRSTEPASPAQDRICSPFLAPFVWDCRWPLSLTRLQQAAALLCGTHDFTSMAATDPDRTLRDTNDSASPAQTMQQPNPTKTITHSAWHRADGLLLYRITGSGFLHHMVRNIVGTLVEIGRGSLQVSDLERILAARDRTTAGPTAPARGLFLVEVHYEFTPTSAEAEP
jgi:tRNA pseudouridine38-40 synthase